jgi:hypothetical protein
MEITLLFILLPGLLAYGITQSLCGSKQSPISDILVSLALQSTCVFLIYSFLASFSFVPAPSVLKLAGIFYDLYNHPNTKEFKAIISSDGSYIMDAIVLIFFIALVVGFLTAFEKERRFLRRIGKRFHLFQSNDMDSAWKDLAEMSSAQCWAQVFTRDNRHLTGSVAVTSVDYKDGGIGLRNVHELDIQTNTFIRVADYTFVSSAQIKGPIFFTEPIKNDSLKES